MKRRMSKHGHQSFVSAVAPRNSGTRVHRVLLGVSTLGTVRIEWFNAVSSLIIPVNWSNSLVTPTNFLTPDAQNVIAHEAISKDFGWVLLIEDDVVVPADLLVKFEPYLDGHIPIVSGLYHQKDTAHTPHVYRGRGNGAFRDFKPGEKVWCDAFVTGLLLMNVKILRELAKVSPDYQLMAGGQPVKLKRIFEAPRRVYTDPELGTYMKIVGTSDIACADAILKHDILAKAGWPKLARRKWPFLVDTGIAAGHICRSTGVIY